MLDRDILGRSEATLGSQKRERLKNAATTIFKSGITKAIDVVDRVNNAGASAKDAFRITAGTGVAVTVGLVSMLQRDSQAIQADIDNYQALKDSQAGQGGPAEKYANNAADRNIPYLQAEKDKAEGK